MAKLTEDQKKAVAQWAADGATLNAIQDRLRTEFSLTLTYMDTRLLVMELGLKLQDKPTEVLPEPESQPSPADAMPEDAGDLEGPDTTTPDAGGEGGGNVTLSIDEITIPGTMVSGK